ncbi:metallophosphoesterase [Nanoarchaeota archaeon]
MNSAEAFLREGILVDPDVSEHLKGVKVPLVEIIKSLDINFLSRKGLMDNYYKIRLILENLKDRKGPGEKGAIEETINFLSTFSNEGSSQLQVQKEEEKKEEETVLNICKKDFFSRKIKILKCYNSVPREINVQDFVGYFKARYNSIKSMLKEHTDLPNLTLINKLSQNNKNISIIGMVISKRVTKNKNVLYEVEDLTGRIKILVNINKPELIEMTKEILLDEVVGFKCSGSSEILFVNDIVFPGVDTLSRKKSLSEEEIYAAFISDVHLGSDVFLEENFVKFIDWINGKTGTDEQKAQSKKIKYLFMTGDNVDGVGIFPGQETKLKITDLREQYSKLTELLKKIRKEITIIMCPGQHDSVRLGEPQPPIGEEYAEELCRMENVIMVSNPAMVEIDAAPGKDGIKVLMYHGASFHAIVNEIEELRLGNARREPTKIVKYVLKKRHLGIPHLNTVHIPYPDVDPLVIDEMPDVIVTGDLHRTDVANYKGVLMVASSCWQPQTDFEAKVGNVPDPCKVPLLNLKDWRVKILDFSS